MPSRADLVHQELVSACRTLREAEHTVAVLLAELEAGRLHHDLGYASVFDYAVHALGLEERKAHGLLHLGRALPRFPVLDRAFAEGTVSWTKAREMLRVLTPDNEAAWVARATASTSRELEADLRGTLMGELPPHVGARKATARTRVVFTMDTVDAQILRDALAVLRARLGEGADEVDDGELLASLARRALHDTDPDAAPTAERWRVVVERCPDCGRTEGETAELTDTAALLAACDARVVEGERESSRVPPAVRRAVLLRDQRRCRVPGCANHLWCDVHHVRARALGGPHDERNLVVLCDAHHVAVHDGRLAVEIRGDTLRFRFPDGREVDVPLDPRRGARAHADARPASPP